MLSATELDVAAAELAQSSGAVGQWGSVENVDPVFLDDLPEAIGTWIIRQALEHETSGAVGEEARERVVSGCAMIEGPRRRNHEGTS